LEYAPYAYIDLLSEKGHGLNPETAAALPKAGCTNVPLACHSAPALVLTHDCEISQSERSKGRVVLCPIKPLADLSQDTRGNAKKNKIPHLFFLPRYKAGLADSVAFLNQLTTVHMDVIRGVPRIATLHVVGRKALYAQYLRWLSRWELTVIQCPQCEMSFDPSLVLPTRAPEDE
jgi:hypothetical protein